MRTMLSNSLPKVLLLLTLNLSTVFAKKWPAPEVIERDVCVIGGGSSGTYAAIRLQQMGKSVALIEKQEQLGGHVDTYVDPATGQTLDYGVVVFFNISVVRNYFAHFDIPLALSPAPSNINKNVNFDTGALVPDSELITGNLTAALLEYAKQEAKFPSIFPKWDLPYPVPEELLMPFGDFIAKYNLEALAYLSFSINQGVGNVLAQPVLYMMKYLDPLEVDAFLGKGFLYNVNDNNQGLYDKAQAELGSSAFVSSNVTWVSRSEECVEVSVSTPDGPKHIKASKLIIAIPPKLSTLGFLDLDKSDAATLGKFNNSYYWDALIENTGIPDKVGISNVNPEATYNLPALPGLYGFGTTPIPNIHTAYYSSGHFVSDDEVKADILATLARVRKSLGYSEPKQAPKFVGFNLHAPFQLTVSTEEIKKGFYKDFSALQGKSNTWWTGAAWQDQASSNLWNFTEYEILPQVMA